MANNERPKRGAEAKKDKAIFFIRMVGIVDEQTELITEDGLGFLE
jgi:hypothetical protein